MIVNMFPDPADRARAMGIFAFVASAGGAIGLLAGGLITQVISWHWIFFVNLPIGAATILLAWRLLDSDEGIGLSQGADVVGAVTVTAALMLGVYAIVESDSYGLGSVRTLAVGGVSILLLGAFLLRQARVRNPILPLSLLRGRNLAAANVIQSLMVAAFFGFFFLGALDLQRVLGYGPMAIGLAFMPTTVTMGLFSVRFTAPLIMRFGSRAVLLAGLTLIATGMMWLWRSPMASDYLLDLLPAIAVLGLGGGLAFTSLTMIAMSDTTPADSGVVSGLLNTTTQMGAALGLAVLATISAAETGRLVAKGQSLQAALSGGYHLAWGIGAGLTLVALGVAAIVIRTNRAPAQPCPEAAEVERACA
jgi:MFS family permease